MRPALAVAAGALLLGGALLVTAPATLLDARVAALSDGHLRIANAVGTIWNGSGEVVLLPSRTREALRWQIDAWPLLRGEVHGAIGTDIEGAAHGSVVYGRDHFELRGLDLALPVESMLPLVTSAKIALGGTLSLQLSHLAWLANALDGQLALQWRDASVPGLQANIRIALGDVRIDLSGHGIELAGPVHNTGGDVEISGQLTLTAAGAMNFEATLRPREADRARADMVTAAISSFGTADGQGGYHVRWSGAWR